jgi:hypothetical protein
VLNGEATHTNFIIFGFTRTGSRIHDLPNSRRTITPPMRLCFGNVFYVYLNFVINVGCKSSQELVFFIHLPTINKALNLNMTSFIGYINNTVLKLPIYFNSNMVLFIYIIPKWIHIFIQDRSAFKQKCSYCFFTSIGFHFCNLSSSGDVVYKERWRHWHRYFMILWVFYLFKLLKSKYHNIAVT